MLVRYSDYLGVHQTTLGDFIHKDYRDDYSYCDKAGIEIPPDPLVVNLVELLVKTKRLSVEEFESLLPHKNYHELISFDEDWVDPEELHG